MLSGSLGDSDLRGIGTIPSCFPCHSSTYQHPAATWKISLRDCSGDIPWSPKIKRHLNTGAQVKALKANTRASKKECLKCRRKISWALVTFMTLWLAISQQYPPGSCITKLLTGAEPLLCARLCPGLRWTKKSKASL